MLKIKINPENIVLETNSSETIIESGKKAGIVLPLGCGKGFCGVCKTQVESGNVEIQGEYNNQVLTNEEISQGKTLLCKAHALSDLSLYLPNVLNAIPERSFVATVKSKEIKNNISILTLKLNENAHFKFYAGQYIDIIIADKVRSYSIANSNKITKDIELHIKHHAGGIFSEFVRSELSVGDVIHFNGPKGVFRLQNTDKPIFAIATGTGFAPIKSMLDELIALESKRQIILLWGNKLSSDFYIDLNKYKEKLNISVTLSTSQEEVENFTHGRVTDILKDYISDTTINLKNYEFYACGSVEMIQDNFKILTDAGIKPRNLFSDAFTIAQ